MPPTKATPSPRTPTRAVAYLRVSTTDQGTSGLGLDAQRLAVEQAAAARGWQLTAVVVEVASGKSMTNRPQLAALLHQLDTGQADALVTAKLDRLSRSLIESAELIRRANARPWALVACDMNLDTSTSAGRLVAHMILSVAEYEREQIGERTRAALAAAAARGTILGRRSVLAPETRERIVAERAAGATLAAIAAGLNADGVPTGQGGRAWYAASVQKVLRSRTTARLAA